MSKNYLKFLESASKRFKAQNKEVFDIVAYGSFVRGKRDFNDIDVMLIFSAVPLKKRLGIGQHLKEILKKEVASIDVKTMNLGEFFDEGFLARQGLLVEGISLIKSKPLAQLLGFEGICIFTYNLKNLSHNKKTQFTYALSGRNSEGILSLLKGASLGRGAVKVPIGNSTEFEEFLQKWEINYKVVKVLESKL